MATQLPVHAPLRRPTDGPRAQSYTRRRPEATILYEVVREQLETFLCQARERDRRLPRFVEREFRGYLECGILAHGFVRVRCDAVTFVQRFGSALNLNVHFHSLMLDGVYEEGPDGMRFFPLPPPDDAEVERLAQQLTRRLVRLLERRGLGPEADASDADPLRAGQPLLAALYAASVAGRVATEPRVGRGVLRRGDRIDVDDLPLFQGERCASVAGVSLHANVVVPARDRHRLEQLCRYVARPPLATERLSRMDDGRLLYRLKRRWVSGAARRGFPMTFVRWRFATPVSSDVETCRGGRSPWSWA